MASGSAVQVEILASFGDFQAGLAKAAQSMQQMAKSMGTSLATVPPAVRPASESFGGLEHSLKAFKSEQVAQGRMVGFYVRELVEFTGAAGATKTAMGGMLSAAVELMGGLGPLGIALASFEVLKTISQLWRESGETAKKAAELAEKTWTTKMDSARSAVDSVRRATLELLGLDPQAIQNAKDLVQKNREIAALRKADPGGQQWEQMDRLKKEKTELEGVVKAYREAKAARDTAQIMADAPKLAAEGAQMAADLQAEVTDDEAKEFARREAAFYAHLDRVARASEKAAEEDKRVAKESALEYDRALTAKNKRRMDYDKKITEALNREAEESARSYATMAVRVGDALGGVITNAKSFGAALAGAAKVGLHAVIDSVRSMVLADAAASAAEAFKSQAGIPVVGPYLGLAAMAAAFAVVSGLVDSIPSASGGFDIGNFNPLTQLHAGEMVLPKPLADNVRSMTSKGGGGATVNISAFDTQSVERGLTRSDSQVMRAIRKMQRRIG